MKKIRIFIFLAFLFVTWGWLALNFLSEGRVWAALFAVLPFLALILLFIFPEKMLVDLSPRLESDSQDGVVLSDKVSRDAFPSSEGDSIGEFFETERQYHLRMAKWWFVGFLFLPQAIALAFWFDDKEGFSTAVMFAGILFGIPCFLKCLGSLYKALRAKG